MAAPKHQPQRTPARNVSPALRALFNIVEKRRVHMSDIALDLNVSRVTVYYWKSGARTPGIDQVEAFAQVLGVRLAVVEEL